MIAAGFEWLKKNVLKNQEPIITVIDGQTWVTGQAQKVDRPRIKAPLQVASLDSLLSYINDSCDCNVLEGEGVIVNVCSPSVVTATTELDWPERIREELLIATSMESRRFMSAIEFGRFYPLEEFNIIVMTQFHESDDYAEVLQLAGNVSGEDAVKTSDDGMSQSVVARKDIATVDRGEVKNPMMLAPRSTFAEVTLNAQPFVLRFNNDRGPMTAALFDASGGEWQSDAMSKIRGYLADNLAEDTDNVTIL